jgi:hypothetical protein
MRTEEEKQEMLDKLEQMKGTLPEFSAFGDNNWQRLDDQKRVIVEEMDEDDVYGMYEGESEDWEEEFSEDISTCLTVVQWLSGQDVEDEIIEL